MAFIIGTQSFPKFDMFHAHCGLTATFPEASCQQAFNSMKDSIQDWHPEPKAGGTYKIWDAIELEQMWVTRTTPTKHYVDDIIFEYFGNPKDFRVKGCKVKGRSRSQSLSYYDYDTNYCNMWNVFQQVKDSGIKLEEEECKWAPKDPATACAKY